MPSLEQEETISEMIERLKDELEFALSPEVIYQKGKALIMAEEAMIVMETRIKQAGFIVEMIEEKLNAQQVNAADNQPASVFGENKP